MPNFFRALTALALVSLFACTDAVAPTYQFDDGFLLIEGRIADTEGFSEVRVARNQILFENYILTPVPGATVSTFDDEGQEVGWAPVAGQEGVYRAPAGWTADRGRRYGLRVVTPDGEMVESLPEPVPTSVPIVDSRVRFEQEAYYSEGRDRFIPAFTVLVDVDDPAEEENYYQYNFTYFEEITVCASCERARWRDGECIAGPDTRFVTRWDYLCDARCWISTRAIGRNVMSDAFGNGQLIPNVPVGRLDYSRPGGVLFAIEQYNTSRASFDYNSVIENLAEGGGGLNAPLPAALVGNLTDVSANATRVLGFVGVTAVNTDRVFVVRDTFPGESLPYDGVVRLEPVMPEPPKAPCEGGSRSRVRPEGWED